MSVWSRICFIRQCQTQTQRLLGSIALKPYAICQFDLLVPIEALRLKWLLKLYCLKSSDYSQLCTVDSIQKLQTRSLFPMEIDQKCKQRENDG